MIKSADRKLSDVATRVAARMRVLGFTQADLVHRSGLSRGYVSELLRGDKQSVKHAKLLALANALEVPVVHLTMGAPPFSPFLGGPVSTSQGGPQIPDPYDYYRDIEEREAYGRASFPDILPFPLRGSFRPADRAGELIPLYASQTMAGTIIDPLAAGELERPPLLVASAGAYAVVADSRMPPRYIAGELLYVAPDINPRSGKYVFVILRPESDQRLVGRVWRLKYLGNDYVRVESFNPPKVEQINLNKIAYIHQIVLAGDAGLDR